MVKMQSFSKPFMCLKAIYHSKESMECIHIHLHKGKESTDKNMLKSVLIHIKYDKTQRDTLKITVHVQNILIVIIAKWNIFITVTMGILRHWLLLKVTLYWNHSTEQFLYLSNPGKWQGIIVTISKHFMMSLKWQSVTVLHLMISLWSLISDTMTFYDIINATGNV